MNESTSVLSEGLLRIEALELICHYNFRLCLVFLNGGVGGGVGVS